MVLRVRCFMPPWPANNLLLPGMVLASIGLLFWALVPHAGLYESAPAHCSEGMLQVHPSNAPGILGKQPQAPFFKQHTVPARLVVRFGGCDQLRSARCSMSSESHQRTLSVAATTTQLKSIYKAFVHGKGDLLIIVHFNPV